LESASFRKLVKKVFYKYSCIKLAENLYIPKNASRETIYEAIFPQIEALVADESDLIANLANISAVLKDAFGFFWVGFYLKKGNQLVLGPFQGPLACTRINFDRGVCGFCYTTKQTVIVPDVDAFPSHIACSSASKSEIVVPAFDKNGEVFLVLDVDSDRLYDFSETDQVWLEKLINVIEKLD
jgi:L-methionine (R)-S-oxide reductase